MMKMETTSKDQGVPQVLLETMARTQGLMILCGTLNSGVERTAEQMLRQSGRKALRMGEELPAADSQPVLVFEGEMTADRLRRILDAAEEGRFVLLLQKAPSPLTVLHRLLSLPLGEGRSHVLWRLCDQLLCLAGQMKVRAIESGDFADVHEILLMSPTVKGDLIRGDLTALEETLRAGEENSGTVSFNQSLLQLLLRRRVDIKTAFEVTRDPINLDQILKKVGI